MGLSGRKIKQRIGSDPRNLSWADNAAKFGQAYLSKLGWNPSEGLGARGDGVKSHIKVAQKLNLLGIGAGSQQAGPEGVAWEQNREYEELLERLNQASEKPSEVTGDANVDENNVDTKAETEDGVGHKRKRSKDDDDDDQVPIKKEKKKKSKKSKTGSHIESEGLPLTSGQQSKSEEDEHIRNVADYTSNDTITKPETKFVSRPMAHRARFLASKRLAVTSSSAVSEILGIAPSSSVSPFATQPTSSSTPIEPTDLLTTSTKSVAEYFKELLATRNGAKMQNPADLSGARHEEEAMARPGIGVKVSTSITTTLSHENEEKILRTGLDSSRFASLVGLSAGTGDLPTKEKGEKKKKKKAVDVEAESRPSEMTNCSLIEVAPTTKKEKKAKKSNLQVSDDKEAEGDEEVTTVIKKKKRKKSEKEVSIA